MKRMYERVRRMPGNRKVLLAFLCLCLLSIFFVLFSDEREYRREFSLSRVTSYMEGFRVVSRKGGQESWVITARKADFSKDDTLAKMDSVTMDMKKEGVLLNAEHGIYNLTTKALRLEDNITIHMRDSVIHTSNLSWNPSQGLLTAEGKVRMEGAKFVVEGEGLTATQDNRVQLTRNVKAIFH